MTTQVGFHRMLLNDSERMQRYRQAIHAVVRPGDTVLDVGSGSGVLALFACQAGAGRVHCVERDPVIAVARELAAANGFADRIVFHKCDASDLQLDGQVDVIQSELMGKGGLGERMAEIVGDCRDRFLRPGGAILPLRVDVHAALVDCPEIDRRTRLPRPSEYGVDFAPIAQRASNAYCSARIDASKLIGSGHHLYRYEAASAPHTDRFDTVVTFELEAARNATGFTIWFEAELAKGIWLGNRPPGTLSWDNHYFPLMEPLALQAGDTIEMRIAARDDSSMSWLWRWDTRVRRDGRQIVEFRQSTFHADVPTPVRSESAR